MFFNYQLKIADFVNILTGNIIFGAKRFHKKSMFFIMKTLFKAKIEV